MIDMMRVDVSEIKTFKTCKRQWELSSRNKFHLRPKVAPKQLAFGTVFHDALAQLYLGVSIDKVEEKVKRELDPDTSKALMIMVKKYNDNVLSEDLKRFRVLDIEHHFEFEPLNSNGLPWFRRTDTDEPSLVICGSIDMIVLDVEQNKIYGFEHKTCKNFRDESFLWMDEQPRLYTWALQHYVDDYNYRLEYRWLEECRNQGWDLCSGAEPPILEPKYAELGGIYLNEVRKLLTKFDYRRTLCKYTPEDMQLFMNEFLTDCMSCKQMVDSQAYAAPKPSYFTCSICQFKAVCSKYMYAPLNESVVLADFNEEFVQRTADHLDEKTERSATDAT